jgi:GDPmannose 4,6-dehydratase
VTTARRALVLGASGQDGSYMCELLVERGYDVVGLVRRDLSEELPNLAAVRDRIRLVRASIADVRRVRAVVHDVAPGEIYNFASVSFGPDAWSRPVETARLGTVAFAGLIQAVRDHVPSARLFQASSAWVFGAPDAAPQTERTPYAPVEPYGAAKAFADHLVRAYRDRDGLFACSGILYNHESPRRPERFVTRKVARAAASISLGRAQELELGDLDALRDWGYARDFVEAAWSMLQADTPADHVVATGETHSVRELAEVAFAAVGLDWREHVRVDDGLRRDTGAVANLVGDASALRGRLGWRPTVGFEELVRLMVEADVADLAGPGRAGAVGRRG